jgi:signal transduction histidine kinase/ActR/RegA family two-component response regulator
VIELGKQPLVLVQCGWSGDRQLIGQMLRTLGADDRPMTSTSELRRLLAEDRVDLVLADTAAGHGLLGDLLRVLDGQPEARDMPVVLLAEPEELPALAALTARRFNVVLLTKPMERESLVAAIQAGLRFQARHRQNRELLRRLAAANAELERRRAEAAEESRRKTRFLAAVSHDIRTPVNALVLSSQLLRLVARDRPGSAEVPKLIESLHSGASSLVELVNDLMDIVRYDQGKLDFVDTDFSLGEFLPRTLEGLRPLAEQKGLTLTGCVSTPRAILRADAVKLARVVGNLVSNAIKFTEEGSIWVTARADRRSGVILTVRDTGCGIPAEMRESIFDEFQQLRNPERDRTKGTGLGLSICRRLVTGMGGDIRVIGAPGQPGSTFQVTLPAGRVLAEAPAEGPGREAPADEEEARFAGRVLVVEDHESSRQALQRLLQQFGLTADVAANGREALAQMERQRPDLVLLDLMMPVMGGMETLRALRQRPDWSDLPVVILTGDLRKTRDADLRAAGATAFLSKPVALPELTTILRRFVRPAADPGRGEGAPGEVRPSSRPA